MVILLNWKVVSDLQCQHLEAANRQTGFEGLQSSLACSISGPQYLQKFVRYFLELAAVTLLSSYTAFGSDVVGTLCPELHIPDHREHLYMNVLGKKEMISLEYLPLQPQQLQPKYGTCFSSFLCLSFHDTRLF